MLTTAYILLVHGSYEFRELLHSRYYQYMIYHYICIYIRNYDLKLLYSRSYLLLSHQRCSKNTKNIVLGVAEEIDDGRCDAAYIDEVFLTLRSRSGATQYMHLGRGGLITHSSSCTRDFLLEDEGRGRVFSTWVREAMSQTNE